LGTLEDEALGYTRFKDKDLEDTVMTQHVIYHAQCQDGFASAFIAWRKFGDAATYSAATYGQLPPDVSGEDVTVVDFCYPRAIMDELNQVTSSLTVLDHHATALVAMQGFCPKCGTVHFDMAKSGARLTFEHLFPDADVPELILRVEDGDLNRFAMAGSKDYLSALDTVEHDFRAWEHLMTLGGSERQNFIDKGAAVNARMVRYCESVASEAVSFSLNGVVGLMVNAPRDMSSDLSNLLARRSGTFGGNWYLRHDGSIKVSLRSVAPFEVKSLAESFPGGGGHLHAASFSLGGARLGDLLAGRLNA
jgi:hypothetical protein